MCYNSDITLYCPCGRHLAYNLSTDKLGGQHMEYGYARVSTKEQNELRQLIALREFGLTDRAIFVDKQSGKDWKCQEMCSRETPKI